MKLAHELRTRVGNGEVLFGTFVLELTTPAVVPVLKNSGFGFFMIDLEHGLIGDTEMRALISAGKQYGLCPIVRVPDAGRALITRALDAGAEGVLVAMVQTMEDVRQAVQSAKYPPLGGRGVHMLRPHTDFVPPPDATAYRQQANREIILGIQIETVSAVAILDQIAATPGVDLLYLGPTDLAVALGAADVDAYGKGMSGHDNVMEVAVRMARACRGQGKLSGIHAADAETLGRLVPEGVALFGHSADLRLFRNGAEAFIAGARKDVLQARGKAGQAGT
jgi:4-hydroxy-2-oxoheptanedioate aldolase